VKLVNLAGFITKKFVTMHGHMNVKKGWKSLLYLLLVHIILFVLSVLQTIAADTLKEGMILI